MKVALTYDDINLIPKYSEIPSRQNISLTTYLSNQYSLMVPFIASPMDTICDSEMALSMAKLGGVGIIHRFMTIEQQVKEVTKVSNIIFAGGFVSSYESSLRIPIAAAVGANGDYLERAQALTNVGANVILIDVAHGHHSMVRDAIKHLKSFLPSHVDVIAGNIATKQAAIDLQDWGADALRVGIGGGSLCTTRIKTGFGVPNVTSLMEVAEVATVPVIACGGIRNSGDIAKALALGADSVILGSVIAGTQETPGKIIEKPQGLFKRYRGAASLETKSIHNQKQTNVEGESTVVPFKGSVKFTIEGLSDGVRSALSYAGATNLAEYHPDFYQVTNAGTAEAKPHLLL